MAKTPTTLYEYYQSQGKSLPATAAARWSDPAFAAAAQKAGYTKESYAVNAGNAAANTKILSYLNNGSGGTSGSSGGASGTQNKGTDPNAELRDAINKDPSLSKYDVNSLIAAYSSGDWSGFQTPEGKPFDASVANAELDRQMKILDPFFKEEQAKGTEDLKRTLSGDQAAYENYLNNAASSFANEKNTQDTTAAQNGVLFSSGRVAKLNNLQNAYSQDAAFNRQKISNDIGANASDFAYKYGTDATKNLSSYFNLGGQNYNPFVARGGATPTGISSVYTPPKYYGTNNTLKKTQAIVGASGVLANKGNKLFANSYNWQY